MSKTLKKIIVIIVVTSLLLTGVASIFAQAESNQEGIPQLEERIRQIEAEILKGERNLTITQAQRETYQREINNIRKMINQLNLQIRQARAKVQILTGRIRETETSIDVTLSEIDDLRGKIAEILREVYRENKKSTVEVLASDMNISGFFNNSTNLEMLSLETKNILGKIVILKINLEEEKEVLDDERSETEQLARIQALQAEEARRIQVNQEALLRQIQNREAEQKREISNLEREAEEIRARIIQLAGLPPDVPRPTLGEALDIARWVQQKTGVQPAFLVAIIIQESALGRNVGQCYITDTTSGNSRNLSGRLFRRGIHPTRDLPIFLQITKEKGRDPLKTPISCWINLRGPNFGWGGAIGPAQFLPSTWMLEIEGISIRDRVSLVTGNSPANPWNIRDSFMASGIYLRHIGAANSEIRAAARYFGAAGLGYESSIMRRRNCLQVFIDQNTMTSQCRDLIFIP